MPAQRWRFTCCGEYETGVPVCRDCGALGQYVGWRLTMHEMMSAFTRGSGLPPYGPRRMSEEGRAIEARMVTCPRCDGLGVLDHPWDPSLWAYCPQCKGNGAALDGDFSRPGILGAGGDPMNGIIPLKECGEPARGEEVEEGKD